MQILIQIIGWVGTILIVTAYFLVSRKTVNSQSKIYQLMNLFGAVGVGVNVFYQQAWPALALQIIWGIIAISILIKIRNKTKVLKKWSLIINRNKHLGSLLLLKLYDGKYQLKLSMKTKVISTKRWGPHFGILKDFKFEEPEISKRVAGGETFEVGYIFEKQQIEIKQEIPGGGIERSFHKVAVPIEHYLFAIIIRNSEKLNDISESKHENIVLSDGSLGKQVAIVFSFEGPNGKPFMHPGIEQSEGRQFLLNLNGAPLNKIYINAVKNNDKLDQEGDFLVSVPNNPTKITQ